MNQPFTQDKLRLPVSTHWLSCHVDYVCRHSGACCSSRWPIPVEHDRVIPIQRVIDSRTAPAPAQWLDPAPGAPDDVAGTLAVRPTGECVFLGIGTSSASVGRCAIHSVRPSSCVHFPYVCLIDPRGVHVTLSHYCPTAARMLVDYTGPVTIVEGPPPVAELEIPEGLDAREALPPLESPARLMGFEDFAAWERREVAAATQVPALRTDAGRTRELFEVARAAVPAPLAWPSVPADFDTAWAERVEPHWDVFAAVAGRYRAAKIFASWAAYQGDGIAAVIRVADVANAVLRVEVARQCARAGRALDTGLLVEAVRQSDLLMVHYADPRVLSSAETLP